METSLSPSYTEENLSVLKKMKYLTFEKRNYILLTCGSNLIYAFSELLSNLVKNSNKDNLKDNRIIRLIKNNYEDLGYLIDNKVALKVKRQKLSDNKNLQRLALNVSLNGYLYFKEHHQ